MRQYKQKMKFRKDAPVSIRELLGHLDNGLYTRQTLVNLFRTLLEGILEDRVDAIVLMKIDNTDNIESVISRLGFSSSNTYVFNTDPSSFANNLNFKYVNIDSPLIEKEEFLVILSEKFSGTVYWSKVTEDLYGLYQGAWSFNPGDTKYLSDYLSFMAENEELNELIKGLKADRRYDERFTTIMTKLVASLENRQRDLICANKELKDLHEKAIQNERLAALGQLSSVIAHELRNPLGMIDLYAKLLVTNTINLQIEDPEQQEIKETIINAAETIRNSTQNLEVILTELLNYAKPLELKKDHNDLQGAIKEVYDLMLPKYEESKVYLNVNYNVPSGIEVLFDRVRINQALLNVVKNALEVSEETKSVTINVDCRSTDGTIYIKVTDQGKGISEEGLEKLFTPYFTTKEKGTGLGLAQSKKIMKAHGGDIEVLSTSEDGTTFALIIPGQYTPMQNIETF